MPNCLECDSAFHGRADKKFCTDHCRTSYHNKLNSDTNNYMRNINNILRKNRRILLKINSGKTVKVRKTDLLELGFKFNYFTNEFVTQSGKRYRFCYDQGYLLLDNNKIALVRRKEYVE